MTTPAAAAPDASAAAGGADVGGAAATDAPTPTPPAPQPPPGPGPVYDAVLVGGGPRAVAVVERLAARRADAAPPVRVAVIDAVEVGAGATWRTDQSPLLLNNTYSAHTTIHADASTRMSGPVVPGPDLITWARDSEPPPDRPAWVAQEASELRPWSFPTRRLQGVYYREQLARAEATGRITVTRVLGSVTDLSPTPDGRTVHLRDGRSYTGRRVVLAQGMVQAKRSPRVAAFVRAAADHDLVYVEPGMPAERDWARVPAGETVLVAGLGANFFDVVALLTEGRGGRFTPAGDGDRPARLRYLPSGREPRLVAGSRRGLPYRAKADYPDGFPPRYEPALATPAWFAERAAGRGQDFRRDVWPQLAREFAWAHLSTLLAHHPEALRPGVGADDLLAALRGASDDAAIDAVITDALAPVRPSPGAAGRATAATTGRPGAPAAAAAPDPSRWALSVSRLDRPYLPGPVDTAGWHQAVRHHIDAELDSVHNPLTSPRNTVNRAMAALRGPVRRLATAGALDGASVVRDVDGWFNRLGLALASGPPPHRTAEVLALIDAGVLELLGEDTAVTVEDGAFVGRSAVARDQPVRARAFVETRMSKGIVTDTDDPLLGALLSTGRARLHARPSDRGPAVSTGTLDVTPDGFHLLAADGTPDPAVIVLGIPAEAVQPGSAIGATPGVPSPLLTGADNAAAQILAATRTPTDRAVAPR
ncbi:FAD/NAD(P)-binding protein [Streptomyces spiramenti]|uniref:FAD/NAD(P)-binding protein n=1 Tax=Streptomyces spiramenti TaxID=2720606 RepID=A0ABX1AJC6_9ACTN|nr:FAD/NAD(P)-binding protein [Streptomyces spiramenti]NJP66340.1 FAD/NAD(P)-binding protein [Streptomyces spiramenti]